MRHRDTSGRTRKARWLLGGTALAALAFTMATSGHGSSDAAPSPSATPHEVASTTGTRVDLRPTRVTIPRIDVRTTVVQLGLNKDGTVEVPADPDQAGWYHLGSAPGRPGSAVILGHVDSQAGPAVFYRLRELELGDTIDVQRADGSHARFEIDGIATYPNAKFPAAKVYRIDGPPHLTLVTCGGAYDSTRGGYQANLVVSAKLIGSSDAGTTHD